MKYDGVVIRIKNNKLFLFLLDPDTNELKDGINISDHVCYKDMKSSQLMVVKVTFKDGSEEIDKIDLDEFIFGDTYGKYDTFLHINDIMLFSLGKSDNELEPELISLEKIAESGDLSKVAINCIKTSKKEKN